MQTAVTWIILIYFSIFNDNNILNFSFLLQNLTKSLFILTDDHAKQTTNDGRGL